MSCMQLSHRGGTPVQGWRRASSQWTTLISLTALLAVASVATAQNPASDDVASAATNELDGFEAYLDGVVTAQFTNFKLAGMTFALVRDAELVFSKGYGVANIETGEPVDPATTLFRPGSVSKLFTWTAVMQLVEQGKIDLNAPISNYVDQFEIPNEFDTPLTMTHILTHTPGFEDGAMGFLFAESAQDLIPLPESLEKHIPAQVREPGTYAAYSNWATALAGLAVANVSGMSFEDYVAVNIFQPLGMTQATFDEPLSDNLADNMAQGYKSKHSGIEPMDFEFVKNFGPAGALSAAANDMAKFIIAHVQDGAYGDTRILNAETAQLMHSRLFAHDQRVAGMAHGFYEIRRNGERFIGHGGDTIAFHSELVLQPETDFGFFVSFNTPDGARARAGVTTAVLDWFFPGNGTPIPTNPDAPLAGTEERITKVIGSYRVNRRSYTKLEGVTGLAGDLNIGPAGKNGIMLPGQNGGNRFIEIEPWIFRQQLGQETLVFKIDAAGNVTHALIGAVPMMAAEKLATWEQASIHQLIILLTLIAALFVLINAIRNRGKVSISGAAMWGRLSLIWASVCFLIFAAGFGLLAAGVEVDRVIFDFPPPGTGVVLVLPLLGTLFTAISLGALVPVWRSPDCNVWQRIRFSYVTLVYGLFVLVLGYWNLLGWKY